MVPRLEQIMKQLKSLWITFPKSSIVAHIFKLLYLFHMRFVMAILHVVRVKEVI